MELYDLNADLYGVPIDTNTQDNPDFDMAVYAAISPDETVYILHDRPFQKTLSWVEYNATTHALLFVMSDGDARDFGITLTPAFQDFLITHESIAVAQFHGQSIVAGDMYKLIIHGNDGDEDI
jgi:hypothetical protein